MIDFLVIHEKVLSDKPSYNKPYFFMWHLDHSLDGGKLSDVLVQRVMHMYIQGLKSITNCKQDGLSVGVSTISTASL